MSEKLENVEVELGLKLQNQDHPFVCNHNHGNGIMVTRRAGVDDDGNDGDGDDIRCGGPTYTTMSSIYDVGVGVGVVNHISPSLHYSTTVRDLQPFDVFHPSSLSLFKSSANSGMAAAAMGFPFTAAQWKELERQATIFKYMVASLPVPPDLLYPSFPTNFSTSSTLAPSSYVMGSYENGWNDKWVGNSKDAEPGRCRRTDGKKWRCSRDVAPNQKYCDRHLHRGRPRSRKPVELLNRHYPLSDSPINKNNSGYNTIKNSSTKKTSLNVPNPQSVGPSLSSVLPSKVSSFHNQMVSGVNQIEESRSLAWSEENQWQQLVQTNIDSQVFLHQFEGNSVNLNFHVGFNAKSDMSLLERPLFDAWSMGVTGNKDDNGSNGVSFSSTIGDQGNAIDENMCQIHMGLGIMDSWVGSSTSPGGPLAEVLRPGSVTAPATRPVSNTRTSNAGEGGFVTPPSTTVSSPSGVLQKTLASFSDSSGSSSPTCHNKEKSDMPFHWLN